MLFVAFVVTARQLDDAMPGVLEQATTIGVRGQYGAVARQCQTQRFHQAVHGVGREHARAAATGRAGAALDLGDRLVVDAVIGGDDHGIDQIEAVIQQLGLAGFHRTAGDEDDRDVEAHGGHQHPRGDLVTVGDAHQRIRTVGIHHVFDAVGDQVTRRQRIQHAVVAHGDAIIDRDGVEFLGDAAGLLDLARDQLPHVLEVDVARHELGEGVGNGDDRLLEVAIFHAGGAPQGASAGHVTTCGGRTGAILWHGKPHSMLGRSPVRRGTDSWNCAWRGQKTDAALLRNPLQNHSARERLLFWSGGAPLGIRTPGVQRRRVPLGSTLSA